MDNRTDLVAAVDHLVAVLDKRIDDRIASLGPEPLPTGEYISIREVAATLAVDTSTVRRWLRDGALPGTKVAGGRSGTWRIRRADLDAVAPTLADGA